MRDYLMIASLVAVAACGGDDKPEGMVNSASARTSVDQVGMVSTSMGASNGGGAAGAVQSMTSATQSLVSPKGQAGRVLGLLPLHQPKPDVLSAVRGTADCNATMCTFVGYGDDNPTSGWTIDGTIKVTGDTYVYDLTYDVTSPGSKLRWEIDADLVATPTMIDGNLHNKADTIGEGFKVNWDVNVDFNGVTLDGAGCPIGGSIHGETAYTVSTAGVSGQGYEAQGDVTFGPACGQTN